MKKVLFLLIIIIGLGCFVDDVHAESFYGGPWIDGIYLNRDKGNAHIYQQAQILYRKGDHQVVYCIEPFKFLEDGNGYSLSNYTDVGINEEVWNKINLIAYYGYGYQNHGDEKWYPITQILIWQQIDPSGHYYFTDSFDGNEINIYERETEELINLVENHMNLPTSANQNLTMVLGQEITLEDRNDTLEGFGLNQYFDNIKFDGKRLLIKAENIGSQKLDFTKFNTMYYEKPLIYHHSIYQDLLCVGDIPNIQFSLDIEIIDTSITVYKEDFDNGLFSSGDASLNGTVIGLYNHDYQKISEKTIDENTLTFDHLPIGIYFIKELKPGTGYQLNDTYYQVNITKESPHQSKTIKNKVKMGKLILHKTISDGSIQDNEALVNFAIYDKDNNLVETLITDINGQASALLPFGTYLIKQITTTENYQKIEDFWVTITDHGQELAFELVDYLIDVPNTRVDCFMIHIERVYYVKEDYMD